MRFWIPTLGLVALTVVILLGMRRGWLGRKSRTSTAIGELPSAPVSLGTARTAPFEGTYIGTTVAGEWLERVTGEGLGSRAAGTVQLFDAGILVVRQGAPDVYIPIELLDAVRRDRGIAGKVADPHRLVVLSWRLAVAVDTGILLRHPAQADDLVTAVESAIQQKEAG